MAYKHTNDVSQFYKRTNKLPKHTNGLVIKVDSPYGEKFDIKGAFVVDSVADTLTFTAAAPTSALDVAYFQFFVNDGKGSIASDVAINTELSSGFVIDTTGLNYQNDWEVTIYASDNKDRIIDHVENTLGTVIIADPANDPTVNVDTTLVDAAVSAVTALDGTAIADAGSAYDLGTFAAGGSATLAQKIIIKNSGEGVLIASNAVAAALSAVVSSIPFYVYANDQEEFNFTIDTSGTAGAKSTSITFTTNDPANPTYVVNLSFTLS